MFFGRRHVYCKVTFDTDKWYWYRSNRLDYRAGYKVVVPVGDNGLRKIGTVIEVKVFKTGDVPYPLVKTKAVIAKAGFFARREMERHNSRILNADCPIADISLGHVDTPRGRISYCTCALERSYNRWIIQESGRKLLIIENYPVSPRSQIPPEARQRLDKQLEMRQAVINEREREARLIEQMQFKRRIEREIAFEEFMEELDQYN